MSSCIVLVCCQSEPQCDCSVVTVVRMSVYLPISALHQAIPGSSVALAEHGRRHWPTCLGMRLCLSGTTCVQGGRCTLLCTPSRRMWLYNRFIKR